MTTTFSEAEFAYISDMVDEATRTVKVRSLIPNPRGRLKPDMFVRGRIA